MNTFRPSMRFSRFRNLCMAIVAGMVFGFYFIYDYIYGEMESWNPKLMAIVFLIAGILLVAVVGLFITHMKNTMYYRLTAHALEFSCWGRSVFYPYSDFVKAYHRLGGPFDSLPITFELSNKKTMELNQYISGLPDLTLGLLERIEDHAELEEGLKDRAASFAKKEKAKQDKKKKG
ncbi:MAG: hypothetical protein IJT43_03845 [Stomatobaculum sp.]|nr:hypothetical protein [Stomatobaculum sp.]